MDNLQGYCDILITDVFKEKDAIEVQMTVSPKLNNNDLFQSLNIPRSNSLDNNYFTLHYRHGHNRNNINRSICLNLKNNTSPSLFPVSGYTPQLPKYDFEDTLLFNLTRSVSLNSTISSDKESISTNDWKSTTTNYHDQDIYPDMSRTTIKPPHLLNHETCKTNQYGTIHALTVRGSTMILSTSQYPLRSFHIGQNTFYNHTSDQSDLIKSVCFSPAIHPNDDHRIVWAGTETGAILAIDILSDQVLVKRMATHAHSIIYILRHKNTELWTIDIEGHVNIWINKKSMSSDESTTSSINLLNTVPERFIVSPNLKTAILSLNKRILWCSSGRSIDKLDRSEKEAFPLIIIPDDVGGIIQLIFMPFHQNQIFALHSDGKITAWDLESLQKTKSVVISLDKLTIITCVGSYHLWAGYSNGTIAIYDTRFDPWIVIKIWKAHTSSITRLQVDEYSINETMSVVSVDSDGNLSIWDGLLADDWFGMYEFTVKEKLTNYEKKQKNK